MKKSQFQSKCLDNGKHITVVDKPSVSAIFTESHGKLKVNAEFHFIIQQILENTWQLKYI